ncbi:ATPdependent DNA helicase ii, 70 kDa subunit (ku70) superfamily protein [Acanthamoeba castellanii str. Neff]|uniref:ATPdependent DNA helicase ii, 70 kDa subunit (Ku70) superfamily protein n=1 Tax=Acanthamoeba castellanii (strain ATCC 30010 / Neff) TaxID=1257118 RepID=L8HDL0_ACACF|nr:ATPdependent DNA helicase ii, 70 kDa subunit (ku70) superfamily protein [Acanthamoeba castellanii str. Neff]ELR22853.1 ATPdependent DNA helicase ii, 70 kDa subunit (ku70) superfamily protein [Acanthamoeba castellanii str. Neff]
MERSMFELNDRGEMPFHNAVKCAIATLTDKIISSENDLVGVCFYGTEKKNNPNDFEGIYVLQELDVPDAQRIMDLEGLLPAGHPIGSLTLAVGDDFTPFGHCSADFPFCDALWTCSTMFSNCAVKVGHKRIFLFTNEDDPNAANKNLREQSFQRAKNIISVSEDEDTGTINFDASSKFEELRARVRRKEFKKRAINRLSLLFGEDVEISRRGGEAEFDVVAEILDPAHPCRCMRDPAKTPASQYVLHPLLKVAAAAAAAAGTLLMDSQIKYAFPFGGAKVVFDKEEALQVKSFDKKALRLVGFKPRSAVKPHLNLSHSSFIYPDEQQVQGSTVAFAALLDRLLASDKVGICLWTRRTNTPPRFVALVPQEEEVDDDGLQVNPPGFHLVPLPFSDDIREIHTEPQPPVSPEQVIKAKKLVKALRINFDSRSFENPSLQRHYANLQALALDRDTVEETPDYLLPDTEGMENFAALINDFKDAVFPSDYEELRATKGKKSSGSKRKREPSDDNEDTAAEGDSERPAKKSSVLVDAAYVEELRQADSVRWTPVSFLVLLRRRPWPRQSPLLLFLLLLLLGVEEEEEEEKHCAHHGLSKLTVPQLKSFLQQCGLAVSAKLRKPQLLELLQDHCLAAQHQQAANKDEPTAE